MSKHTTPHMKDLWHRTNRNMNKLLIVIILLLVVSCKDSKKLTDPSNSAKERISFVTNRDGNAEIYLMDIDGGNLQNLTNHDSLDFSPSWSSEGSLLYFYGKFVLFMSERDVLSRNIYVMNKDGSNIKPLTQNKFYEESPAWSPNGQKIIFTRQLRDSTDNSHAANGEIHIMHSDGSNVQRLTNKEGYDSGAKFSPDGQKIAFYGVKNNQWDIFIMNSDGSNLYNLTNDTIECYSPDWSPNGKWLVYTAGTKGVYNIWKINLETKQKIQLTNTTGRNEGPAWGKNIDFITEQ